MSTFNGKIEEIPGVSVDCFEQDNLHSSVFFLSHCHTDHMRGLYLKVFQDLLRYKGLNLYTSAISKEILTRKYPNISEHIKELNIQYSTSILVGDISVSVTCIPAGHCPGSVMFLFETERCRVLYTGDYRMSPRDVPKIQCFYDSLNNVKKIDRLYLDTTFFLKSYPSFPTREQSLATITKLITEWTSQDSNNVIILKLSANYGYEYMFKEIFNTCRMKVHVDEEKFIFYSMIPEMDECLTRDHLQTQIFSSDKYMREYIYSKRIRHIKPSAYRWVNNDSVTSPGKETDENGYHYVCYSTHASYEEGLALINFLKPKDVYVCVERPKDPTQNLEIRRLIENALSGIYTEREVKKVKYFEIADAEEPDDSGCQILDSPPR